MTVTAPEETAKSLLENDAIPFADVDASSPAIEISLFETVVDIPVPPETVNVSLVLNVSFEPLSAASVNEVEIASNANAPEPSVFKNSPALPSAAGRTNVTLPESVLGDFSPIK